MILIDTDHFSVLTDARDALHARLATRLRAAHEPVVLPIISVEEQMRGWLAHIRRLTDVHQQLFPYDRLIRLLQTLADWEFARWSQPAADIFVALRKQRIRIGTQDLKIAAIALANDALLLSANLRDFQQVPNVRVEDWLRR